MFLHNDKELFQEVIGFFCHKCGLENPGNPVYGYSFSNSLSKKPIRKKDHQVGACVIDHVQQ